jgi:hypothetical protein
VLTAEVSESHQPIVFETGHGGVRAAEHDGLMANPRVWVSTTKRDVALGPDGPGAHWEEVGTIDTIQEKDLWRNVQVHLGLQTSAPRLTGFYLHGMASSRWVVGARDQDVHEPFWLAIDPFGDGGDTSSLSHKRHWVRWRAAPLSRTPVSSNEQSHSVSASRKRSTAYSTPSARS